MPVQTHKKQKTHTHNPPPPPPPTELRNRFEADVREFKEEAHKTDIEAAEMRVLLEAMHKEHQVQLCGGDNTFAHVWEKTAGEMLGQRGFISIRVC